MYMYKEIKKKHIQLISYNFAYDFAMNNETKNTGNNTKISVTGNTKYQLQGTMQKY